MSKQRPCKSFESMSKKSSPRKDSHSSVENLFHVQQCPPVAFKTDMQPLSSRNKAKSKPVVPEYTQLVHPLTMMPTYLNSAAGTSMVKSRI